MAEEEIFINGWTKEKILTLPKGQRPPPEEYLSADYISKHLSKFENEGAAFIFTAKGISNPKYSSFVKGKYVMLQSDMDVLVAEFQRTGNLEILETGLGYKPGDLAGQEIYVIRLKSGQYKYGMPSGNEDGANTLWDPGGLTSGGNHEAVMIGEPISHGNSVDNLKSIFPVQQLK